MYIFVPFLSSGKLAKRGDSAANFASAVGDLREVARAACGKSPPVRRVAGVRPGKGESRRGGLRDIAGLLRHPATIDLV